MRCLDATLAEHEMKQLVDDVHQMPIGHFLKIYIDSMNAPQNKVWYEPMNMPIPQTDIICSRLSIYIDLVHSFLLPILYGKTATICCLLVNTLEIPDSQFNPQT